MAGSAIYSFAVVSILTPNEIAPGGFTGIASSLNFLTGAPTGLTLLILNIPVTVVGYIKIGSRFIIKTFAVTLIISFFIQTFDYILPKIYIDKLLGSVFGGIFMGIGISLVILRGATTGGSDIIAKLINKKFPHITIGKIILITDVLVVAFAAVCYKNIESALYSVIGLYAASKITDTVVYGFDKGKVAFIVSEKFEDICKDVSTEMKRGITKLKIVGGYKNAERTMLMCTVRRHEISALYSIIKKYDKNAFTVLTSADEILGEGFKDM